MSAVETASPSSAAPAAAGPRSPLLPVLAAAVLSSVMAAGAVWFIAGHRPAPAAAPAEGETRAAGHDAPAPARKGTAIYLPLSPAFTVNLADPDGSHFLQVDMEVMARDSAALDAVKQNMPQIRNALLMLLGQLRLHDLGSREAKEVLQKQVVAEIGKVVTAETGKPGVESVFFTSFVVQ